MLLLPILLLVPDAAADARLIDRYRDMTRADYRCRTARQGDEVVVCGRRDADRYRLPLIIYEAGDPKHMGVPEERARLIPTETACDRHGPFLIGCGMAGVHAGTGGFGLGGGERPLAP